VDDFPHVIRKQIRLGGASLRQALALPSSLIWRYVQVRRTRSTSLGRHEAMWGYILVSPWIIGFILFTAGPMLASLGLSLTDYDVVNTPQYIGLTNYARMLTQDPRFWQSLKVTLVYAVLAIPLGLAAGLGLALLLNVKVPGIAVWRTIYYMPSVVSGAAVSVLWLYIFNPRFGVANWILSWFHIKGPNWLSSPDWALPSLILMSLWGVGGGMIIYLAGLQGVPTALYDAALVDGANSWQRFWHITLPMISPVIFYNLVTGIIGTFQYFTNAYIMTDGGPNDATLFYNLYLYVSGFRYLAMGYASALAWVLFFIVLGLTTLIFKSSAAWVYYEGELRR
jgi:multiple sugar transport system permease protein